MKKIILLVLSLSTSFLSFSAFSQSENPSQFCLETNLCTEKMQTIVEGYTKGDAEFSSESLIGFSGSCYHLSDLYDSEHEHHGAFLFERTGNELFTAGVFNFFYESDPYQKMTSSELKAWFVQNNSSFDKTSVKADHVELQYLSTESNYSYWFSENKKTHKFYVLGKQIGEDYLGYVFCEMNRR